MASSTNQSQNAFQANSYSDCASRSKRYAAKWFSASAAVLASCARIQRSASVFGCGTPLKLALSVFISTKRVAFHSLLQKFL